MFFEILKVKALIVQEKRSACYVIHDIIRLVLLVQVPD